MDYYSFYMEKWLPIIGYDWYEVSDLGRVRSLPRELWYWKNWKLNTRWRTLKWWITGSCAYQRISIFMGKVRHVYLVHRLVYCTFNNLPYKSFDRKIIIDHIDWNKLNNNLSNLQSIYQKSNLFRNSIAKLTRRRSKKCLI